MAFERQAGQDRVGHGVTLLGFTDIAAAICRRRRIRWRCNGEHVGADIHRPNALTPYVLYHATHLSRRLQLDTLLPPWRFLRDRQALLGMRVESTDSRLDALSTTIAGAMYLHGLDDMLAAAEVAVREQPEWAELFSHNGDWRICDTQLVTRMSHLCYGERMALDTVNGPSGEPNVAGGSSSRHRPDGGAALLTLGN